MKHFFSLLFLFSFTSIVYTQGTIQSFTISPTNPIITDTIYIYANVQFNSGSCDLDQQSHGLSGNTISASSHHCIGAATVICPSVDTFKINPLAVGPYTFNLSLTSGIAPAPCTAGVAVDDTMSFQFRVTEPNTSGLDFNEKKPLFNIYPNPARETINIQMAVPVTSDMEVYIYDLKGRLVKRYPFQSSIQPGLEAGIYFLGIMNEEHLLGLEKLIVLTE